MVDNRLEFLMDLQINMSLEERGRKQERGMIISSNLRGTPKDQGAISGINSILPQPNSYFL